jgi:hypothetical protein
MNPHSDHMLKKNKEIFIKLQLCETILFYVFSDRKNIFMTIFGKKENILGLQRKL